MPNSTNSSYQYTRKQMGGPNVQNKFTQSLDIFVSFSILHISSLLRCSTNTTSYSHFIDYYQCANPSYSSAYGHATSASLSLSRTMRFVVENFMLDKQVPSFVVNNIFAIEYNSIYNTGQYKTNLHVTYCKTRSISSSWHDFNK